MFEITFGNWVPICRFMHTNIGGNVALAFLIYRILVGIAFLRIVYSVFLHVTLSCAEKDEELMVRKKAREIKKFANRMYALFKSIDTSGDGTLTKEEFCRFIQNEHVKHLLATMELDVHDGELVYNLIDVNKDGNVPAEEMVKGFARLKGSARNVDIAALIQMVK